MWKFDVQSIYVLLILFAQNCVCLKTKACQNSDAYYFNVQPKGITVREGGRAFLECNVSNRCNIQFQWTLNEKIINNSTRRYQNGSNLVITRVNRTLDIGDFHCVTTMGPTGVSKQSQPAQLMILWLSENISVILIDPKLNQRVQNAEETKLDLKCISEGSGDINYKWFYNGRRVKKGKDEKFIVKGEYLTVTGISFNDNGIYSCEAENSFSSKRSQTNFVLEIKDASIPSLIVRPQDLIAAPKNTISLNCDYKNAQKIEWKNVNSGIVYSKSGRIRQLSNNSLLISEISQFDEGSYECLGYSKNDVIKPQSFIGYLNIAFLRDFRETSFEPVQHFYVVGENKRFEVACISPLGFPTPNSVWKRNNVKLKADGRIRADGLRLVIDSARTEDAGEYLCEARNLAGAKQSLLKLHVSHPPTIIFHPGAKTLDEGENATFSCKFKGSSFPVASVSWLKNGTKLESKSGRIQIFGNNGSLVIHGLQISDRANYICVVKTVDQQPVFSKEATLSVRAMLKFSPKPVDKKLELGSTTRIVCKATGHKKVRVRWLKVGEIDKNGTTTKSYKKPMIDFPTNIRDKDGTLFFRDIGFEDAGIYMCTAMNSQGFINATIKVEVVVSPVFVLMPVNGTFLEGSSVYLHCNAKGSPNPHSQWYFDGLQIDSKQFPFGNFVLHANNTLVVFNLRRENAGKYMCMVGNKAGFAKKEALICTKTRNTNITNCGREFGFQHMNSDVFADSKIDYSHGGNVDSKTIGTAIGVAAGYLLLMIVLISWCSWRRRQKSKQPPIANGRESRSVILPNSGIDPSREPLTNGHSMSDRPNQNHTPSLFRASENGGISYKEHSPNSFVTNSTWSHKFTRDKIDMNSMKTLGSGVYGDVFIATAFGVKYDESASLVLVKTLLSKDETIHGQLREEMEMFGKTEHPNLARFLALFSDIEPILVVYEYFAYGNLKRYMTSSLHYWSNGVAHPEFPSPLTSQNIIWIAYQVAQGMEHLVDARFVHKDIAARNVVVSDSLRAKVTSLSLQNDLFMHEYFIYKNLYFPLRWMPAEALLDDDFSMKSDVWSYGVFLWELYNCGELPYQQLSNEQVIEQLKAGQLKLSPPTMAINEHPSVAQIMQSCWEVDPRKRPTFTQIRDVLGQAHVETTM